MDKNEYLSKVISLVKGKHAKREIEKELSSHIDDRIDYYTDAGYDREYATAHAIEMMGSPTDVAKSMEKLYNNTLWVILSILSMLCYIAGMIYVRINPIDFAVINMVDFDELSTLPCVLSVLIFLAGALAFCFAKKSKSSLLLTVFGVLGITAPIFSLYAQIPFGYQAISLFTDFPVAIITKQPFFEGEVFWHLDDLFESGINIGITYSLVVISVLISLMSVVMGIVSLVYAKELSSGIASAKFEKRVNKFAVFVLVLSLFTLTVTLSEVAYDNIYYGKINAEFDASLDSNYENALYEFEQLNIPMTKDEVKALAKEKDVPDFEIDDIDSFGFVTIYQNDAYNIIISDDYEDGIFECKRFLALYNNEIIREQAEALKKLKKGDSIDKLFAVVSYRGFSDYSESVDVVNGDKIINVCVSYKDESFSIMFENDKLVDTSFFEEEELY